MTRRILKRTPVTVQSNDLRTVMLGDLEEHYLQQQLELTAILLNLTPEQAQQKIAEDCAAALEASVEERERERLRRRRLAVEWIRQGRGLK